MQDKSKIAGVLMIVSGTFVFVFIILITLFSASLRTWIDSQPPPPSPPSELGWLPALFGLFFNVIYLLLGSFAIVTGILTIKRKSWALALAGAIASAVLFSPCGIPAILLVSFSHDEFPHQKSLPSA